MKLIVLTGFLGAGKTTLLTGLLKAFDDQKIGVLMNEFGEIGIDGRLIEDGDFKLMELDSGSIFCACLKENFIQGLVKFLATDLEVLFVESSGVSDPSNMGTILETVAKLAGKSYEYLGSICVVDGLYFKAQREVIPALGRQLAHAAAVIINKADLQTPEVLAEIEAEIETLHPGVKIYRTAFCEVDFRQLVAQLGGEEALPQESLNTWESRPKTGVITTETAVDYQGFGRFLHEIIGSAHRIKGFVKTNAGNFEVSCVNDFSIVTPWDKPLSKTEMVIISSVGVKIISVVLSAWKTALGETPFEFK